MTAVLVPLVCVLAALTVFDLVLTAGLIRRLRDTPASASPTPPGSGRPTGTERLPALGIGEPMPRSLARSFGDPTTGSVLVGVFSTECKACPDHLPDFDALGRRRRAEGLTTVAVLSGEADRLGAFRDVLGDAVTVVEDLGVGPFSSGAVTRDLGVRAWPSYVLFDAGGHVAHSAIALAGLPLGHADPVAA
ncbi:hypothetical protein GCM10009839_08300 [Catenulispora yoronensis]|uniref:Thioredoxin domain-containing protein n=1 Tax=Catenulispora yoronensis TaxID=450799 RepID=A0ABN2TPI7_9ACTN